MRTFTRKSTPQLMSALIIGALVVSGLVAVAPEPSAASGGHTAVALLTPTLTPMPTPTPTAGGGSPTSASCELTLVADQPTALVGDAVTFDLDVDCVCLPAGAMPVGVQCNFLLYELASVDSGGLFESVATPIGPPGPTSVTLNAVAAGSTSVTMAWYGELVIANGISFVYTWATIGAAADVTVFDGPTAGDVDCSGELTLLDARAVARYAINALDEFVCDGEPMPESIGDINADDTVSLRDARDVALCAIGLTC